MSTQPAEGETNGSGGARPPDGAGQAATVLAQKRLQEFVVAMARAGNPGARRYGARRNHCVGWSFEDETGPGGKRKWIVVGADGCMYERHGVRGNRIEPLSCADWLLDGPAYASAIPRAVGFAELLEEIMRANGVAPARRGLDGDEPVSVERQEVAVTDVGEPAMPVGDEVPEFEIDDDREEAAATDAEIVLLPTLDETDEDMVRVSEPDIGDVDIEDAEDAEESAPAPSYPGSHPSTASVTRVRSGQIIEAILLVLRGHPEGLTASEVTTLVEKRITLTEFEGSDYPNKPGVRRFDKILRFTSIPLTKASWITIDASVWTVTPEGEAMIGRYDDPADLAQEATRLYRQWKKAQSAASITLAPEVEPPSVGMIPSTAEDPDEEPWLEIQSLLHRLRNIA